MIVVMCVCVVENCSLYLFISGISGILHQMLKIFIFFLMKTYFFDLASDIRILDYIRYILRCDGNKILSLHAR